MGNSEYLTCRKYPNSKRFFANAPRRREVEERLGRVHGAWKRTVSAAQAQNAKLSESMARSATLEEVSCIIRLSKRALIKAV